jgi:hypothetical protein
MASFDDPEFFANVARALAPGGAFVLECFVPDPVALRCCWPSELDLMARLAGLDLAERHAGWDRGRFEGRPESHVSVYGVPAGG